MKLDFDFKIKCPEDYNSNQLWKEFISWLNKEYNGDRIGNAAHAYYGPYKGTASSDIKDSSIEEISLEKWKDLIEPKLNNFSIHRPVDYKTNDLWEKYIAWLNTKPHSTGSGTKWLGDVDQYYSYKDGYRLCHFYKDNDLTELSLTEWNKAHGSPEETPTFKVGDRVQLSEYGREFYDDEDTNPHDDYGTITQIDSSIEVDWDNGKHNAYDEDELDLVTKEPETSTPVLTSLPADFCIECPVDYRTNPIWKRFIAWVNDKWNVDWDGDQTGSHYGKENGTHLCQDRKWGTVLTLEQWDAIVNPTYITLNNCRSTISGLTGSCIVDTYATIGVTPILTEEKVKELIETLYTNKQTMSTYSKLKMESFFADKRNVKAIDEMKETLRNFHTLFGVARENVQNMEYKAQKLANQFELAVASDDFEKVEQLLEDNKALVEFMTSYASNTVITIGTEKVEPKDPLKFFE